MRVFPFRAFGTAIRDALRTSASAKFGAEGPKLIEHDDHWLRPTTISSLREKKAPAVFVALNTGTTGAFSDQGDIPIDNECAFDIVFVDLADRSGQLRLSATLAAEWIYELFSGDGLPIPGFTPPPGVLVKHAVPVGFAALPDLMEVGLVGSRVIIEVSTSHEDPDA